MENHVYQRHLQWMSNGTSYSDFLCRTQDDSYIIYFFKVNLFIFNWRIVALQYCVGFCHTATWISHRYTYVYTKLYRKDQYKKVLRDPDNHDGVITHLEPDILECKVKWALESITPNKASGGDGIPVELFQILKDDAVKVLHSICQQIWRTQQWPQE